MNPSAFRIQHLLDQPIEDLALAYENEGVDVVVPTLQDPTIFPDSSNCNEENPWDPRAGFSSFDAQLPLGPSWMADPQAMDNLNIDTLLWDSAKSPASSSDFYNIIPRVNIPAHGDIRNKPSSMQKIQTSSVSMLFSQYVAQGSLDIEHCVERYFTMFHPLWPIVHRGTFGFKTEDADLIDSVVMIGAWESGIPSWMEAAIDVRPKLVTRTLGKFVSLKILILAQCCFQEARLTPIAFNETSSANQHSYSLPTKPCS